MKRKIPLTLCFVIILTAFLSGCKADKADNEQWAENNDETVSFEKAIEDELIAVFADEILEEYGFNGTMIISVDNKTVYEKSVGYADPNRKIKNENTTHYQVGSLTKQITGAVVLQLEEKGKLNPDDTLDKYFDGYDYLKNITVSELLNMTAGFKDYIEFANDESVVKKVTELIKENDEDKIKSYISSLILENGIEDDSGEFRYNNSCYYLLGLIIEKASGISYREYVKRNIFEKADMRESGFAGDGLDMASGYEKSVDGAFSSDTTQYGNVFVYPFMLSAGSVVSTAEDMNKWLSSFTSGKIVSKSSLDKVYNGKSDYSYGFFVNGDMLYHIGNTKSYTAVDFSSEKKKIRLVALTNIGMYENIEEIISRFKKYIKA